MSSKTLTFATAWAPEFDGSDGQLNSSLLIFSGPRTGSQTICRLLYEVGLGVPAEYFVSGLIKQYSERFLAGPPPDTASFMKDYVEAIRERRCRNGVLSCKMQADQHKRLTAKLGYAWEETLPALTIVHLRRHDHVGQVVSLGAALQTGVWDDFSPQKSSRFAGLTDLAARTWTDIIFLSDLYWRKYLESRKLKIINFYWEDLSNLEKLQNLLQSVGVHRSTSEIGDMMGKWPRYSHNRALINELSQRFGPQIAGRWAELSANPKLAWSKVRSQLSD